MKSLSDVQSATGVNPSTGLASSAVASLRDRYGANILTPLTKDPLWRKFLEKFDEAIIKILLVAALLSMVVESFNAGVAAADPAERQILLSLAGASLAGLVIGIAGLSLARLGMWIPSFLFAAAVAIFVAGLASGHPSYEGLAVMIAVVLATGVSFAAEYKSDREFELLNARREAMQVKVLRDSTVGTTSAEDLVVGDIVILETGDEIPADGRVLTSAGLSVDQSLMTGESEAVTKQATADAADTAAGPSEPACLYRATQVVDGAGRMMVCAVGDATYLGQIAARLGDAQDDQDDADDQPQTTSVPTATQGEVPPDKAKRIRGKLTVSKTLTPLQLKLTALADLISQVGYIAAVLIFVALLVLGILRGEVATPTDTATAVALGGVLLKYFMYMVIIIVVAVPEGLPMSVTISLALAMQKMTRANSLVRQLVACETIGSATVIASDKTGTLTQNKMTVVALGANGTIHNVGTPDWPRPALTPQLPLADDAPPVEWIALNAAANTTAHLELKDGKSVVVGNITEGALLDWLAAAGKPYAPLRDAYTVLYQQPFSSERKRMTTVVAHTPPGQGEPVASPLIVLVKGAPETLLDVCQTQRTADGRDQPLDDSARQSLREALAQCANQAMRTLGFAFARLPADTPRQPSELHAQRGELETRLTFAGFIAIRDPLRDDVPAAIAQCRTAGIDVKMVTGDNPQTAQAIGRSIGLLDRSDAVTMTGAEFQAKSDDELLAVLPRLSILSRAQPLDKYRLVTLLQRLNHVVAVTGDGTNDAPALKKADVGLAMGRAGTEVAKAAGKIVLLDDSFTTIVRAVHWGRALYENIQRFIQFQLTINVSALSIAFLGPFLGVKPPFTVLQLLWINVIMDTFAAIALCGEPPRDGLLKAPPKRRDENILTPVMISTILSTAAFFIVVMLALLVLMERPVTAGDSWLLNVLGRPEGFGLFAGPDGTARTEVFPELDYRQATIFFSVYVFFQIWNQINCRSLVPQVSGLTGLTANPTFLAIASLTVIGQVLIVTFGYSVFQVQPLTIREWLVIAAATTSVIAFAEIARLWRSSRSDGPAPEPATVATMPTTAPAT